MAERDVAAFDTNAFDPDFLGRLRAVTPARIALARTGVSITTTDQLAFQLAHAQARDAVHAALDTAALLEGLTVRDWPAFTVASEAADRGVFLARPDLGRHLDAASQQAFRSHNGECDVAIVVADGLSAQAIEAHALALLDALVPHLSGLMLGPIVVATQARVALGDEIGAALQAKLVCILIGERPGLSSPDSLGIYLTFAPRPGCKDADRNCLSNIRAAGMSTDEAAHRCAWLIREALARGATGVALKDRSAAPMLLAPPVHRES